MFKTISKLCAVTLLSIAASAATAAPIVWDASPATPGTTITNNGWTNYYDGQHFVDKFIFTKDTVIGGMDVFGVAFNGSPLGTAVKISLFADSADRPGAALTVIDSVVSIFDKNGATTGNDRMHADFAGYALLANTAYWIGMSPTTQVWGQTGLNGLAGGSDTMGHYIGASYAQNAAIGDMAFRLYSAPANVPEPASIALMGLALLGMGAVRRRTSK